MLRGVLALLVAWMIAGCASEGLLQSSNPRLTAEAEALAGRRAAPELEQRMGGLTRNASAERAMESIGERLATGGAADLSPLRCHLLDSDDLNAFSLPGGLIYLTRGLYHRIQSDKSLIAAVIAHEMAHLAHKDSLKPSCADATEALDRELTADEEGAHLLMKAAYPPRALIQLMNLTADRQPAGWAMARIDRLKRTFPNSCR